MTEATDVWRRRRIAAAAMIARQMEATKRLYRPPAEDSEARVWSA